MRPGKLFAVLTGYLFVMVSLIHSQAPQNVDWPAVAGNAAGTRYSALKQINASNVTQLQVAWTYDVGDAPGTGSRLWALGFSPRPRLLEQE